MVPVERPQKMIFFPSLSAFARPSIPITQPPPSPFSSRSGYVVGGRRFTPIVLTIFEASATTHTSDTGSQKNWNVFEEEVHRNSLSFPPKMSCPSQPLETSQTQYGLIDRKTTETRTLLESIRNTHTTLCMWLAHIIAHGIQIAYSYSTYYVRIYTYKSESAHKFAPSHAIPTVAYLLKERSEISRFRTRAFCLDPVGRVTVWFTWSWAIDNWRGLAFVEHNRRWYTIQSTSIVKITKVAKLQFPYDFQSYFTIKYTCELRGL